MYYAFAFYGIWGQIFVRSMLSTLNSSVEVIEAMASFLPVLGAPFLFISWIMLIKMAYSLFDIKVKELLDSCAINFVYPIDFRGMDCLYKFGSWQSVG